MSSDNLPELLEGSRNSIAVKAAGPPGERRHGRGMHERNSTPIYFFSSCPDFPHRLTVIGMCKSNQLLPFRVMVFHSNRKQSRMPGKGKAWMRNCLDQIHLWAHLWGIVLTDDWYERAKPIVGSIIPRPGLRKKASGAQAWEWAREQAAHFIPPSLLLWVPSVIDG